MRPLLYILFFLCSVLYVGATKVAQKQCRKIAKHQPQKPKPSFVFSKKDEAVRIPSIII
jgi:hypothetical protein